MPIVTEQQSKTTIYTTVIEKQQAIAAYAKTKDSIKFSSGQYARPRPCDQRFRETGS